MGLPQATDLFKLVAGATQGVPGSGTHYSVSWSEMIAAAAASLLITDVELADALSVYGTAAVQDVGYFATAAQGALADSAVQPGDIGTAAAQNTDFFATAAQGALADSAIQTADLAPYALTANVYTQAQANTLLDAKANSADVYTQAQVDSALGTKANSADVYTQAQVDAAVALKADATAVYTKAEVDGQFASLINAAPGLLDTLDEIAAALGDDPNFATTMTTALAGKADSATTLAGYGIVDAYTQTQVDTEISDAIAALGLGTASQSAVGDFAAASHVHTIANVTGLQAALDGKQAAGSYAAASHTHAIGDITGFTDNSTNWNTAHGWGDHGAAGYLAASSYTAADVLAKLLTVDGATSGVDADLLDGYQGSYYLDYNNLINTPTGGGTGDAVLSNDETVTGDWDFIRDTAGLLRYTFQNTNTAAEQQTDIHIGSVGTVAADLYMGVNYTNGLNTFLDSRPRAGGNHEFRFEGSVIGYYSASQWVMNQKMVFTGSLAAIQHSHPTPGFDWQSYQEASGNLIWTISGTGGAEMRLFADGADHDGAGTYLQVGDATVATQTWANGQFFPKAGGDITGLTRIVNASWNNHLALVRSTEDWRFAPSTDGTLNLFRGAGTGTASFDVYTKTRVDGGSIFVSNTGGNPDENGLWLHHNASDGYVRANTGSLWLGTNSVNAIGISGTGTYFQGYVEGHNGSRVRIFTENGLLINSSSQVDTLEIHQSDAIGDAFITFHNAGDYAFQVGIGRAENDLMIGGWSMGDVRYRVLHEGNIATQPFVFSGAPQFKAGSDGAEVMRWTTNNNRHTTLTAPLDASGNNPWVWATGNAFQWKVDGVTGLTINSGARIISGPTDGTGTGTGIRVYKAGGHYDHIEFYSGTTRVGEIGAGDTTWLRINQNTAKNIYTPRMFRADGGFQVDAIEVISATGLIRTAQFDIAVSNTSVVDTIVARNASGDIYGRYFFGQHVNISHGVSTRNSDTTFFSSTDNYIRKNNAAGMRSSLAVPGLATSNTFTTTNTFNGTVNFRGAVDLADNDILRLGSGDDVEHFFNGSHYYTDLNSGGNNWYIRDGTTTRFTFDDAGHFTATGNVTAYSDIRLKDKVNDFKPSEALEIVLRLDLYRYLRNDMEHKQEFGFIAQHVEKIVPEMVLVAEEPDEAGRYLLSIDYGKLSTLYAAAIQEQQRTIQKMDLQLQNQEARIARLEQMMEAA